MALPFGADFMPDVVKAQVMHNKCCPVIIQELIRNMTGHIAVYFNKILHTKNLFSRWTSKIIFATGYILISLTDT